jgi:hypothetical protein
METRANYLLVGSFVLIIFAGAILFILWLAKFQFDQQFTRYDIEFEGSVSGLKVGSSVELNGIPVGEVINIGIDPRDVEKVAVTVEVPADTPIREDTIASMQIQGITGGDHYPAERRYPGIAAADAPARREARGDRIQGIRPRTVPRGRPRVDGEPADPRGTGRDFTGSGEPDLLRSDSGQFRHCVGRTRCTDRGR